MKFSFGLITDGTQVKRLNQCIESIFAETANSEIIIVGGSPQDIAFDGINHIEFDETIKPGHITKKKNLIAQHAQYENLVLMHDYCSLSKGWLDGFNKFGNEWLTCTNTILNQDGSDFRSWAVVFQDGYTTPIDDQKPPTHLGLGRKLNPKIKSWGRWQYYSGQYFIVKKNILLEIPFNQELCHFGGEDISWSRQIYKKYGNNIFNWNPYSKIKFLKMKDPAGWENLPEIDFEYDKLSTI